MKKIYTVYYLYCSYKEYDRNTQKMIKPPVDGWLVYPLGLIRMMFKIINTVLFILSILGLLFSFSSRHDFPPLYEANRNIKHPPIQTETTKKTFKIKKSNNQYWIEPLFEYSLTGLVVSYRLHDLKGGIHKRWGENGDNLNIADICVVWGKNINHSILNEIFFYNADYTCFLEWQSQSVGDLFQRNALSNNHLLTEDKRIIQTINNIQIGDQIEIKGLLAKYGDNEGEIRGSSITRDDSGNGACETIYLSDFKILKRLDQPLSLWKLSWVGVILTSIFWLLITCFGRYQNSHG